MTNGPYTKETWLQAYHELLQTAQSFGIPEEVGKMIAKNLGSERCIRRMTSYFRLARPRTMEEVADEMLAIMEDREKWKAKREFEESNARYNAWLCSDEREP